MPGKQLKITNPRRSAAEAPKRHVRQKITMNLDSDIIEFFKLRAEEDGTPYQFLINQILRDYVRGTRIDQLSTEVSARLLGDRDFLQRVLESAAELDKKIVD